MIDIEGLMHVGEIGYQFCQELKTPVGSVALAAVTKYGCAPQRGLGGEIAEFVDDSDFACEAGSNRMYWRLRIIRIPSKPLIVFETYADRVFAVPADALQDDEGMEAAKLEGVRCGLARLDCPTLANAAVPA